MSTLRVAASEAPESIAPRGGAATPSASSAPPALAPDVAPSDRAADDFFRALGRLTASFAALEHQLQVLASLLISRTDQELGRIVTAELSFRKLVDVASSLARYRMGDEPRHRELKALLARAATAEDRRRCVTPAEWGPGSVAETRVRVRMAVRRNKGLRLELQGMTAADVDEVAAEASAIAAEVAKIWTRLSRERRFSGVAG
jgi:hypothetical protein